MSADVCGSTSRTTVLAISSDVQVPLPGKIRLRSGMSESPGVERVNAPSAGGFTTGSAKTAPVSWAGSSASTVRRIISIDSHSTPCSVEVSVRVGPGRAPTIRWACSVMSLPPRSVVTGMRT